MNTVLHRLAKTIQFHSPMRRYFFPHWTYQVSAPQLVYLGQALECTRSVPGVAMEIGCFNGQTTLFLAKYMEEAGIPRRYLCLDTFGGFTKSDVAHEVTNRGKSPESFAGAFATNSRAWFDATMQMNGVTSVETIQADAGAFDYAKVGPIAFAFLDVDLYVPMQKAIPAVYDALSPGGILCVHDCVTDGSRYDGSGQAYHDFIASRGLIPNLPVPGLGVIVKSL